MGDPPAKEVLLCTLPGPEPKPVLDRLRASFPHLGVVYFRADFDMTLRKEVNPVPDEVWKSATIICTLVSIPRDASLAPNLKLIHLLSASTNQIEHSQFYKDKNLTITTSSGIHGPQIAEWSVMSRLIVNHRYNKMHGLQQQHKWSSVAPPGNEETHTVSDLVGCRVGILGYGSIGRQIGRVAKAMGMTVIAYTATPKVSAEERRDGEFVIPGTGDPEGDIPAEWYSGVGLDERRKFLSQDLDWLVVAVPLTKQTHHFLGAEEFKILSQGGKKPAFVTNIARGLVINQQELIEALKNGTLAGAALDVTDPEPLPAESELWDMDNVVISPHIAGLGRSYGERSLQILSENLRRREVGERLLNVVDRERGY